MHKENVVYMDNRELLIQKKNKIMSFLEKLIEREINHIQKTIVTYFLLYVASRKKKNKMDNRKVQGELLGKW